MDIECLSIALKQLVRCSECHLHERLVVSHVDDSRVVHNYIKIINLEASNGALDDHLTKLVGEYISLDNRGF
jgi:hypothetical protein